MQAKFDFTVHFYEYWNPTGLCGECGIDGIPACCDDTTLTDNCSNIGVKRCDTRFRFILRPYGASVKTAPSDNYEYYTRSVTNEIHDTFKQGSGGFLSLPNPHTSYNTTAWTVSINTVSNSFVVCLYKSNFVSALCREGYSYILML